MEKRAQAVLDSVSNLAFERRFMCGLMAKYVEGQTIAKKLSRQIHKLNSKIRRNVKLYNLKRPVIPSSSTLPTLLTFEIAMNPESGLWSQHSVSHDAAFQLKQRLFVLLSLHDRASEEMNIIQRDLSAELGKIEEALRNPPCAKSLRHEAGVVSALRLKIRECRDQLQQCDIVEQLLVTNSSLVESEVEDLSEEEEEEEEGEEEEQDEDDKASIEEEQADKDNEEGNEGRLNWG
ncbi:hypothetical protein SKAU_G00423340 [Synaphobranchus kaupii]|uniref:Uncharacterized protein n=1 Tax=Synaphobranchus kaupii TaxID=118154 RepID=A0A9Q1E5P4_SYNKA|nr:hypothetical protein SKAU_G00423340 [Synaphobranchus kaupii]